jgi:chemotaxis protein MotB|tara:strand:+ start:274 stop:1443 length:1170 start_codon:yes stop_codon:yes gene_type:complete
MAEAQENPNTEEEEEECPKCPPAGAPAWMATFADMATLLMAFFVLILSFAEFNVPKFKQISGSLKNAFGIQRVVPVVEQPRGTTVLALNFSPSPEPSVTKNMTQQSTETEQKNLDLKSEVDERESSKGTSKEKQEQAKEMENTLKSENINENISIERIDDKVVVKINQNADAKIITEAMELVEEARKKTGNTETDVLIGGINNQIKAIAMANENNQSMIDKIDKMNKEEQSKKIKDEKNKIKVKSAEDEYKVALRQEIGQGLTDVKREKDRVVITVGSAGAFKSGSAELTSQAKKIMKKIAKVSEKGSGQINVSGHTDDVPLIFGGNYRDNWDLAAARASSVVQSISKSGDIPLDRLMAISYGESKPLESNKTAEGRAKNRRIEIEIKY